MAQKILALEYDSDCVRAALAERSWSVLSLKGVFGEERAGDEPDLSGALSRLVQKTGRPEVVISALPGELAAKRLLELPFHDRRRLERAVPFALEEHLPFAIEDAVVAFAVVGRQAEKSIVFAAMALKTDVHKHLELLAQAGLDPKIVTLSALGLSALVSRAINGEAVPRLVLDVGQSHASLVLVDQSGTPKVMRTVKASFNLDNGHSRTRLRSDPIFNAVRQTLLSQGPGQERTDIIMTGSLAFAAEVRDSLARALSNELPVSVREAGDFDCADVLDGLTPAALQFASCVGLLLSEMPGMRVQLLDFRHGEFAYRGGARNLKPLRRSAGLAAAVLILAIINYVLGISKDVHSAHLLDRRMARAAAPALGPNPPMRIKRALNSGIVSMSKRLRTIGGSDAAGTPLDQLLALSRAVPSSLSVDIDELSIDDAGIKLSGTADSFASVDGLKQALSASGSFKDIQINDTKGNAGQGNVDFHLSATPKAVSD